MRHNNHRASLTSANDILQWMKAVVAAAGLPLPTLTKVYKYLQILFHAYFCLKIHKCLSGWHCATGAAWARVLRWLVHARTRRMHRTSLRRVERAVLEYRGRHQRGNWRDACRYEKHSKSANPPAFNLFNPRSASLRILGTLTMRSL